MLPVCLKWSHSHGTPRSVGGSPLSPRSPHVRWGERRWPQAGGRGERGVACCRGAGRGQSCRRGPCSGPAAPHPAACLRAEGSGRVLSNLEGLPLPRYWEISLYLPTGCGAGWREEPGKLSSVRRCVPRWESPLLIHICWHIYRFLNMNVPDFSISTELTADCASGSSTVKLEIATVGEILEFHSQKKGMEISRAIVCLKNFNWKYLNIPSVRFCFNGVKKLRGSFVTGHLYFRFFQNFSSQASPGVVVWILPQEINVPESPM